MAAVGPGGARRVRAGGPGDPAVRMAAEHLRAGGLVAFPTETVYGLGARADDPRACARVYEAKGRPADNPLIVHLPTPADAAVAAGPLGRVGTVLASSLWPGPLTLVVTRPAGRFEGAAAGLDTIALRVPTHPIAAALLGMAGVAVAAPSANRSGRPSATRADDVWADLADGAAAGQDLSDVLVLDGGAATLGVESTVVDVTGDRPRLLRPGAVGAEAIEALVGPLAPDGDGRRSPGTRHRHYAPRAEVWLAEADADDAALATWLVARPGVGAVCAPPDRLERLARDRRPGALRLRPLGRADDAAAAAYARDVFDALRWCDEVGARWALVVLPPPGPGASQAVRDRLVRAAEGRRVAT